MHRGILVAAALLAAILAMAANLPTRPAASGPARAGNAATAASASRPTTTMLTATQIGAVIKALEPLHQPMGKPKPGEWLDRFKEPGQSFDQYVASRPPTPTTQRSTIYIQPLGELSAGQGAVVWATAEFMAIFYNVPVRIAEPMPIDLVPDSARRQHPQWGDTQILTSYVLDELLAPRLPRDAAAMIAFTPVDLWPGENWNFVFGQASLVDRVGVWSLYRYGNADGEKAAYTRCLLRAMKTGVHETGHMFGLGHCTAWQCGMNGSNSLAESDSRPLAFCPQCEAKVLWATGAAPAARFATLADWCRKSGLKAEADFYTRCGKALAAK
jgi:archaemetzincin